jgi:hypothetical protein
MINLKKESNNLLRFIMKLLMILIKAIIMIKFTMIINAFLETQILE